MNYFISLLLFCGLTLPTLSQQPLYQQTPHDSTKYLALDAYKTGFITRYRFFVGDELTFKLNSKRQKLRERITKINDSSVVFSRYHAVMDERLLTEVKLNQINKVQVSRRIPWVTQGAYMMPLAGAVFILSDVFAYNQLSGFDMRFDPKAALIGGGIASLGILCARLSFPVYRTHKKHRLHVIRIY